MTEIKQILCNVLTFLKEQVLFLKSLRSIKTTEELTSKEESVAILEDEPLELESKTKVQNVEPEKIKVVVKEAEVVKEVEIPTANIENELKINKHLPQDSMLKRHYLTHLKMMLELIYAPYPTDSALIRHYQTMIAAKIEDCLNNKDKMAFITLNYEIIKTKLKKKSLKVVDIAEIKPQQQVVAQGNKVIFLPEDSVQRRHYLTNVRSIIESNHTLCPTDSTLKRHYETLINTEIEQYLLDIAV